MSKRESSTLLAWAENSAKLTPTPSQVAPSGNECPSRTRAGVLIWNDRTAAFPRGAFAISDGAAVAPRDTRVIGPKCFLLRRRACNPEQGAERSRFRAARCQRANGGF